jgi:hypothetical protein
MSAPKARDRGSLVFRLKNQDGDELAKLGPTSALRARGTNLGNRLFIGRQHSRPCGAKEGPLGRGILLWLLGVPIPIIILLALFYH